jgi:TRAP-type uncharacterized transport system fused permease subunit
MEAGTTGVLNVAATCASAGIIVGVVTLTGLGLKFSSIVLAYAGNNLVLTAIYTALIVWIVGLAVPVTASYIICAVITAPALITLGVPDFAAHMFIFYYALLSEVSRPRRSRPSRPPRSPGATLQDHHASVEIHDARLRGPVLLRPRPDGRGVLLKMPPGGTWIDVAWIIFLGFVAISALAAGLQGWLLRATNAFERALLIVAGLLVIAPVSLLDYLGIAMLAMAFGSQLLRARLVAA